MEGRFLREPRGLVYRDLLAALVPFADRALLTVRATSDEGERVLEQLDRWLVVVEQRAEWPGTKLFGAEREIREYWVNAEVLRVLQDAVAGLYEWQSPMPEDLALLRQDGSVLLYTVGHEEQGGLDVSDEERRRLLEALPGCSDYFEWRTDG